MNETEVKELLNKELAKHTEAMQELQRQNLTLTREVLELREANQQLRDASISGNGSNNARGMGGRFTRAALNEMLPRRLEVTSLEDVVRATVGSEVYDNDEKWRNHVKNTKTPMAANEK